MPDTLPDHASGCECAPCAAFTLGEKLWSAYAGHVITHCRRRPDLTWEMDDMADELQALAIGYGTHGTF